MIVNGLFNFASVEQHVGTYVWYHGIMIEDAISMEKDIAFGRHQEAFLLTDVLIDIATHLIDAARLAVGVGHRGEQVRHAPRHALGGELLGQHVA